MTIETVSLNKSHGGVQGVYKHASRETGTDMTFSVYVPPHQDGAKLPVVWYLSGLTCTHANVTEKGEFRAACAELGLIFVAPDTSPRGEGVPGDPAGAYDFGLGAGFYVDATQPPFARNYRMWSYVTEELPNWSRAFSRRCRAAIHPRSFDGRPRRADHRAAPSRSLPRRQRLFADRRTLAGAVGYQGAGRLSRRRQGSMAQA
jgi:S-formylglutathione hydrolase